MILKHKGVHKIKVGFINDPMASRSQRNNGISGVNRVAGVGVGWSYMQGVSRDFAWMMLWVKRQPYHFKLSGSIDTSVDEPKPSGRT